MFAYALYLVRFLQLSRVILLPLMPSTPLSLRIGSNSAEWPGEQQSTRRPPRLSGCDGQSMTVSPYAYPHAHYYATNGESRKLLLLATNLPLNIESSAQPRTIPAYSQATTTGTSRVEVLPRHTLRAKLSTSYVISESSKTSSPRPSRGRGVECHTATRVGHTTSSASQVELEGPPSTLPQTRSLAALS